MAQHVYVINDGNETFVDNFRGNKISIAPGAKIEMQRREAISFLSMMSPANPKDPLLLAEKRLRMVPKDEMIVEQKFICNYDGKEFPTQQALDDYLETLSDKVVEKEEDGTIRRRRKVA